MRISILTVDSTDLWAGKDWGAPQLSSSRQPDVGKYQTLWIGPGY